MVIRAPMLVANTFSTNDAPEPESHATGWSCRARPAALGLVDAAVTLMASGMLVAGESAKLVSTCTEGAPSSGVSGASAVSGLCSRVLCPSSVARRALHRRVGRLLRIGAVVTLGRGIQVKRKSPAQTKEQDGGGSNSAGGAGSAGKRARRPLDAGDPAPAFVMDFDAGRRWVWSTPRSP